MRLTLLFAVLVAALFVGGCDGGDVAGLLERAQAYIGDVGAYMQAHGYADFPDTAVGLALYTRTLAAAVSEAGGKAPGIALAEKGDGDEGDLAAAFGVAGERGER